MYFLFYIYKKILIISWQILYFPFLFVLKYSLVTIYIIEKIHIKKYGIITPFLHRLWILETKILTEYEEIPKNFLNYVFTDSEQKTRDEIMKALDPSAVNDWVCKEDKKLPKEQQTIFHLKTLSVPQNAALRDKTYKVVGVGKGRSEQFQTGSIETEALKMGLVGWDNLLHPTTGAPVSFDKTNINGMLELIPSNVRTDMANFIRGESEVDEGEE